MPIWPGAKDIVRIAAIGDLHHGRNVVQGSLQPLFAQMTELADVLVICGDLTDYGLPDEARALAREITSALKIPAVAVLGNHDFESGQQAEIVKILFDAGVVVLDGDTTEVHGIGFAGIKGFCGGFGRRALGPWGEDIIKQFVREAVDEALKLESALARLRTERLVARAALLPDPGDRRRRAARDLSRSSAAAVSRNRSAASRCRSCSTATRTTGSLKAEPPTMCPSSMSRASLMRELFPERPFRIVEIDMTSSPETSDRRTGADRRADRAHRGDQVMNVLSSLVLVAVLAQARPAPPPPPTAQQQEKTPPTTQGTKPTASTQPQDAATDGLALQVALDRAGFSPGAIDGQAGIEHQEGARGVSQSEWRRPAVVEPTTQYQITAEDAAGPFEPQIPARTSGPGEAAGAFVQDRRRSARRAVPLDAGVPEEVESRARSSPPANRSSSRTSSRCSSRPADAAKANAKAGYREARTGIEACAGSKPAPDANPRRRAERRAASSRAQPLRQADVVVTVSKATSALTVTDASGKVLMYAPVTSGSSHDPLPIGEWKVNGVSLNPPFNYNPDLFWDADPSHSKGDSSSLGRTIRWDSCGSICRRSTMGFTARRNRPPSARPSRMAVSG